MQLVRRAKAYHGFDGMRLSSFNYQWCLNLLVEVLLLQNSLIRWWSKVISVDSLPNHMVLGGVSCLSVQRHKVMLKCNMFKNIKDKSKSVSEIWSMSDFKGCVESLSSSDGWMAGPVLSNIIFKEFDSRLSAHEWNRKAKEEINLQKDVQVSVQALEQNSLIRWWSKDICVDSLPNHVVLGGVSCLSVQRHKVILKCNLFKNIKGCVESLSSSDGWMAGPVLSNSVFKEFDSRLSAHEWNRKAKEEINLQKDVHVSVQALEQVREFNSKLGSQLNTIDEGDGYSEWQWDCHIPFIRFKEYHEGTSSLAQGGAERSEKR
ncbi:hypothetical protein F2Q68_00019408 [Brassica cretica]|uniref:Uncharacterized protein n=1 Tax=Brassica cretica TaxID=69181 RepID=A0A8S9FN41_BRACR|nr:hypothetical protein F2Q68_00019408 [Brassica cretica]